jgi:hypothetical protein
VYTPVRQLSISTPKSTFGSIKKIVVKIVEVYLYNSATIIYNYGELPKSFVQGYVQNVKNTETDMKCCEYGPLVGIHKHMFEHLEDKDSLTTRS